MPAALGLLQGGAPRRLQNTARVLPPEPGGPDRETGHLCYACAELHRRFPMHISLFPSDCDAAPLE